VTLRKQKNKEMKRLKRALFSRDADATASLWRKEHGSKAAWRQSSCATRDRIHARKCACMRKHQSRGWRSNRVGRNYNVFREHYKQLGSPLVCAEFDADNFDRVTAKVQDWVASQVPSGMQSTTNLHQEGDGTRSRGPADIQSWRRC
jgi:hypothetical protein